MDHHCDWVDNCIGGGNQKYFVLFLLYTAIFCLSTFFLLVMSAIIWFQEKKMNFIREVINLKKKIFEYFKDFGFIKIGLIILAVLSLFFFFFAIDFLYDQYQGILLNQTTIESYKELFGEQV